MTAADVAERVNGVKRERNGGYVGLCPVHADHEPSLRVTEGRDGRVLVKCRANCDTHEVLRALGLTEHDLFADTGPDCLAAAANVVYPYVDEHEHLLFEAVRSRDPITGRKQFRQRRPDGQGGYAWNLNGVRRVLYRLPQVLEAVALGKRIHVVEGEKDADRLVALGLAATTNPMGAGKWAPEYAACVRGADVVVLSDNDQPGRDHARQVAATIPGARIVDFPELAEHGDVSDWLDRGHPVEELIRRCDPVCRLTLIDRRAAQELAMANARPIDAVPTHLPSWNDACLGFGGGVGLARGWHVVIGAASNKGKSILALNVALTALRAGRSVAYILLEGSQRDLLSRLYPMASGENSRFLQPGGLYDPKHFAAAVVAFHGILEASGARFYVADKAERTIGAVVATISEAAAVGCTLVVIDYLQLIRVPDVTGVYEGTVRVSGAISEAAVGCGVVTLGLSQYNRGALNAKDGAGMTIHGLSGGGPLENDADQVLLIESQGTRDGFMITRPVHLAKNRHGPPADILAEWDFRTFRVVEPPVRENGRVNI